MESTPPSPTPPSPSPGQIKRTPNKPPPNSRPPREPIQHVNGDHVAMQLHFEIQPSAARELQL